MSIPTKSDKQDFAAFCRNATTAQLDNILAKEEAAGRTAYADIARAESATRKRIMQDERR